MYCPISVLVYKSIFTYNELFLHSLPQGKFPKMIPVLLFQNLPLSFHTYDYARHFVSACTRILGLEGTPEGVEDQGKLTRVAAVSMSYNQYSFSVTVMQLESMIRLLNN